MKITWILFFLIISNSLIAQIKVIELNTILYEGVLQSEFNQKIDHFGREIAYLGDIDGDGIGDLAVTSTHNKDHFVGVGGVRILFLREDGSVKNFQEIDLKHPAFEGKIKPHCNFGFSLANIGDLDRDGIPELAIGAPMSPDGSKYNTDNYGAIWVLFLNKEGNLRWAQKISTIHGNFTGMLNSRSNFGYDITSLGDQDQDQDGNTEIVVLSEQLHNTYRNAILWILTLDAKGKVVKHLTHTAEEISTTGDYSISDIENIGDLDGDGNNDLTLSAYNYHRDQKYSVGFWIAFLDQEGKINQVKELNQTNNNIPFGIKDLSSGKWLRIQNFGPLVAVGDVNQDGVTDLIGSTIFNKSEQSRKGRGTLRLLYMNKDGSIKKGKVLKAKNELYGHEIVNISGFIPGDQNPCLAICRLNPMDKQKSRQVLGTIDILKLENFP